MATKSIRIGSLEDINQYDDVDFPIAIQVDGPIDVGAAGAPTNPNEAVRLADVATPGTAITSGAVITDHAVVRGDGGARAVQDSPVTINDAGSISIPAAQTVDGRDPSVDGAKLDGIEAGADVTDIANVNTAVGGLAGIANNDLLRWNDPGSTLEAKDIAEVIAGQNVAPNKVDATTGQGYEVNGTQVVIDQQAAEADAGAISAISLGAGGDTVDRATFNTDLTAMVAEINSLRATVNSLLAKLRTHGLINT